jgi:hypothetical protein
LSGDPHKKQAEQSRQAKRKPDHSR